MNAGPKALLLLGVTLIVVGLFWQFGAKYIPLGRLPGDILIEKGNTKFYFPIVTSVLLSVLLSAIAYFLRR